MGHGTEGDVLRGKVTEVNRVANDVADALAGEARRSNKMWGDAHICCEAFAARQRKFAKLMWQIDVQNVRVYLAFQAAKKEAERLAPFTTNAETKFVPVTLDYTGAADKNSRFFNVQADGILR